MDCPRCHEALKPRPLQGVEVDACATCEGLWFEDDELRQAKDHAEPDANWLDFDIWKHPERFLISAAALQCPSCDKGMVALDYDETGVQIDACPACRGVWLDGGEFEALVDALHKELQKRPASEYLRSSLDEARQLVTGSEGLASDWGDLRTVVRLLQYRVFVEHPAWLQTLLGFQRNPLQ